MKISTSGATRFFQAMWLPVVVGLILIAICTYPGIRNLSTVLIGDGGDTFQYAGFQQLVADNLRQGKWPFASTTLWRYPHGFEFARGYDGALPNLFGGILLLITNQPVLTYNVTLLGALLLDFCLSYILFHHLSRSRLIGLIGGVGFGLSFYNLARGGGHLNLILTGGFALLAYSLLRLYERQGWREFLLAAAAVVLLTMSSTQYLVAIVIVTILIGPVFILFFPHIAKNFLLRLWQARVKVFSVGLGTVLLIAPLLLPIFAGFIAHDYDIRDTSTNFSPSLIDFIAPNPYLPVAGNQLNHSPQALQLIENVAFVGYIEVILFLYFIKKNWQKKSAKFLALCTGIFMILSFGTMSAETGLKLPYAFLVHFFPFSALPETARYMIFTNLFMLWIIAVWGKHLKSKWLWSVVLCLVVLERFSWGNYYQVKAPSASYTQVVRDQPGEAVLDFPVRETDQSILPLYYQKSILSGTAHWLGDTERSLDFLTKTDLLRYSCSYRNIPLEDFRKPLDWSAKRSQLIEDLKAVNIQTIVTHKNSQLSWPLCYYAFVDFSALMPQITVAQPTSDTAFVWQRIQWAEQPLAATLFFPQAGRMLLYGVETSPPVNPQSLDIRVDGQSIPLENYILTQNTEMTKLTMKDGIGKLQPIAAGARVTVNSPETIQQSRYVTFWYMYLPEKDSQPMHFIWNGLELIYSDADADVYHIISR